MRKLLLRLTSLVLCLMMVTPAMAAGTAYDSDHLLLKYRDSGTCRTLTGNIRLMCVFVNLPDAAWNESSMQAHKDALSVAVNRLMKEADAYGVPLGFTVKYFTGSASESTSISDDSSAWAEKFSMARYSPRRVRAKSRFSCPSSPPRQPERGRRIIIST